MDWLSDNLWAGWLALAFALGVAELASLDLVLLMLAAGAFVGAISAGVGLPFVLQILLAGGASVAMLALVRPSVVKRLHSGPELQLGHGKLVGRQALVTEDVTSLDARPRQAGRRDLVGPALRRQSLTIKAGETVEVLAMKGATVYVHPLNSTLDP